LIEIKDFEGIIIKAERHWEEYNQDKSCS